MDKKFIKKITLTLVAVSIPVLLFIVLSIIEPERVTMRNVPTLLNQAIMPTLLALGLVCNLSVGNWDFAIGAEALFTAILAGNLAANMNLGLPGMMIFCVIIGLIVGTINGIIYLILRVPTLITSIGFLLLLESMSALIYDGAGYRAGRELVVLGKMPQNYIIFGVIFSVFFFIYNFRPFGSWVKAVGKNPHIAKLNGINVTKVKFMCMMIAGVFAGCYSFMNIGTNSSVRVVSDMGTIGNAFDGIMCVFIAMSLGGLTNLIFGCFLGALLLQTVKLGLVVLHIPTELSQIVVAVFVLIFMTYSANQNDIKAYLRKIKEKKQIEINEAT